MSGPRKAVLVKFPLDEFLAIEAARGTTDRSTWIRARLREALSLSGQPLMGSREPVARGEALGAPTRW